MTTDRTQSPSPPEDGTGRYAWPAGSRLAAELATLIDLRGLRCCDLGCGTGLLGRCALRAGATEVLFADGDAEAIAALAPLCAADARASAIVHHWGSSLPGGSCDVILAGDVLYRPHFHRDLLITIAGSLGGDGVALLSDPRQRLEADLPQHAERCGLSWQSERRADYTLIRLRRAPG